MKKKRENREARKAGENKMKEGREAIKGDGWVKIGLRSHKTEEGSTKRAKKKEAQPYKGIAENTSTVYINP